MKFAQFCIKHKVTTIMAYVMIVIFGLLSFSSLPLALMPSIELPVTMVMTTYTGAGPDEIENLITKPIESACASIAGVKTLQSQSAENYSTVVVTFSDGTDMDEALTNIRDKVAQAASMLPEDAATPVVLRMNSDSDPIIQVGLTGADLSNLQKIAENEITPRIDRINGVASVEVIGGYDREVAIYTNAEQMNGYGLTISYISQILSSENIAIPAGNVQNGSQTLSVRTTGEFKSVEDIAQVLIPLPTGGSIRLGDIADISLSQTNQNQIVKIDGKPCVGIAVQKQSGVNTVQVTEKVKKQFKNFEKENPNIKVNILLDQSEYINLSVDSVVKNILFGILLAAIVLFIYLKNIKATTIISISMPVCIISVFLVMIGFKITMNMMSLGGLAMGVGMIVDNSIVVLENIFRYRSDGFNKLDSCIKGTGEVALSICAGTLTTVAVFLPIGFSGGVAGMMFREFSITISALLLSSLFIALTLVPLMCYMLLDSGKSTNWFSNDNKDMADKPLMRKYKKILNFFITKRKFGVLSSLIMVALFSISIFIAGFEMMPYVDGGQINIKIDMPIGTELKQSEQMADRVTNIIYKTLPQTKLLFYSSTEDISMLVDIGSKSERDISVLTAVEKLRQNFADIAGCKITVSASGAMDMSAITSEAVSLTIKGKDYNLLTQTANELVQKISEIPDAVNVKSSANEVVPQVEIKLNPASATRFGLSSATVGQIVRSELSGSTATKLKIGGDEINVSIKGDIRSSKSIDALKAIQIPLQTGGSIPLSAVADVNITLSPQNIMRTDQSRTITITSGSRSQNTVAINQSVSQILSNFNFPQGVSMETGGEIEEMQKSFTTLGKALIVGLVLIYFVLASQFESFIMPIMIMLILPVSLMGSLIGLPLTGNKISMIAFIGVIMLSGTVVNSSIVLVDYINTRRIRGEEKNEAILNACPRRIRPVLMTTLTTILGLIPMLLNKGESSEIMAPMAIVMITGMIISTIVTLFFTPVYYSIIDSISQKFKNRKKPNDKNQNKKENEEILINT